MGMTQKDVKPLNNLVLTSFSSGRLGKTRREAIRGLATVMARSRSESWPRRLMVVAGQNQVWPCWLAAQAKPRMILTTPLIWDYWKSCGLWIKNKGPPERGAHCEITASVMNADFAWGKVFFRWDKRTFNTISYLKQYNWLVSELTYFLGWYSCHEIAQTTPHTQ